MAEVSEGRTHQAFRFELDPSDSARSALASNRGAARFAYNWGLALFSDRLRARRSLTTLAIRQGAPLAEAVAWAEAVGGKTPWTMPSLSKEWNRAKAEVAPWWAENSKMAAQSGLTDLGRAIEAWSRSRQGLRKGTPNAFPQPRKRNSACGYRVSISRGVGVRDARHVRLPRIGVIRTKEPLDRLIRLTDDGSVRALSATVKEQAGRWYISFTCEVRRAYVADKRQGGAVGVDVGVLRLAVLSTGEVVPRAQNGARYARRMKRLARESSRRQGPLKGRPASKRWRRTNRRIQTLHASAADIRKDGLHKLTTRLATTYDTVVIEDLNVRGMTTSGKGTGNSRAKAGLNRSIRNAALGELRRQLTYKCKWYGSTLVVADRWFPSSKTCSACDWRKPSLSLAERTFRCEECGLVIDRDLNAALNLAALGVANGTARGAGTGRSDLANAQGEERFTDDSSPGCSSTNCEDGTGSPDKTVTVARQRATPLRA